MRRVLAGGALLALVAGALFAYRLGSYPLLDPDEARHAEIAREMAAASGLRRLVLPTLELMPYHEKPPGYYWLAATAYGVGGVTEASARAPSALAALVTVLAVYLWAAPRVGPAGALGAGLVLATSVGWFVVARLATLDMTLTATITLGVLAGLAWLERPSPRRPLLAPYVLAALGTLVKGPIALVLVGGPLALAVLVRRPRPTVRELGLVRGSVVVAAIVATLYLPVALLDVAYLRSFLWTNVRRLGSGAPHAAPVWYYALVLPLLVLPWTLVAGPPLVRAARDPARRPLLLWAAFVPTCLTLARGKLPTYVLSALPPIALLVGPELARLVRAGPEEDEADVLGLAGALTAVLLAATAVALACVRLRYPVPWPGVALVATVAVAWTAALVVVLRGRRLALVPAVVLGAALTVYPLALRFVVPTAAAVHSDRAAARLIDTAAPSPVIAFAARAPSLVFYLRRPVVNTDDEQLVRDLFERDEPVFLVAGRRHFARLEELLGPRAHVWSETPRRRLYANRPAP